jgi:hypothetical protein
MHFLGCLGAALDHGLVFWSRVIVSHLNADFSRVLPAELQWVPLVALAASRDNQVLQINPGFSDQIRSLIVVKNG